MLKIVSNGTSPGQLVIVKFVLYPKIEEMADVMYRMQISEHVMADCLKLFEKNTQVERRFRDHAYEGIATHNRI
jgi:hypothetical protein